MVTSNFEYFLSTFSFSPFHSRGPFTAVMLMRSLRDARETGQDTRDIAIKCMIESDHPT